MADDGLLMNFATDLDPFRPKPVFKGGRWKDRVQAKKSLRPRDHIRPQPRENLTGPNTQIATKQRRFGKEKDESHTDKKRKLSNDDTPSQKTHHIKPNQPRAKDGGTDIISSLFTSNPSTTSQISSPSTQIKNKLPPTPSNAPLPPELHNFSSLGLSLSLSLHINHGLSLKAPTAIQKAALPQLLHEDADAFIQAETGSGKTLAYLIPIVQRILALTTTTTTTDNKRQNATPITRSSGLFALILAPTRELTYQIQTVLSQLLSKTPNIVAGAVTGGSTKNHEKARLRKGLNILVATPGRLVDHLENTAVLDLGQVRWLVLDEGDRLMEMGFEEEVKKVLEAVDKRKKKKEGTVLEVKGLPERRTTVLCSATMKMGVQRLGEMSLKDAILIKADKADAIPADAPSPTTAPETSSHDSNPAINQTTPPSHKPPSEPPQQPPSTTPPFRPPTQLHQSYILTPQKQRLVTLSALLHQTFPPTTSPSPSPPVRKALIFLSCADSVDFHLEALTQMSTLSTTTTTTTTTTPSPSLHKLHASLPPSTRLANLTHFHTCPAPALLLTTDVSARGLDLPEIDLVIEYDPAFSLDEHLQRVGRTARAGRAGKGLVFLLAGGGEEGYVELLRGVGGGGGPVEGVKAEEVLKKGFGSMAAVLKGKDDDGGGSSVNGGGGLFDPDARHGRNRSGWEQRASAWQLAVERWVVEQPAAAELARRAFRSHVRAYATHVSAERGVFDVKGLHLGHLAKAFGLRESPGSMGRGVGGGGGKRVKVKGKRVGDEGGESGGADAGRKMKEMVRMQMAGGVGGADEFNIG